MRTHGEIEAAICEGMNRFEQEYMGRGPKNIHAYFIDNILFVRLQGVLTAAEQHLVKSQPPEKGRDLLKQVRTHLLLKPLPPFGGDGSGSHRHQGSEHAPRHQPLSPAKRLCFSPLLKAPAVSARNRSGSQASDACDEGEDRFEDHMSWWIEIGFVSIPGRLSGDLRQERGQLNSRSPPCRPAMECSADRRGRATDPSASGTSDLAERTASEGQLPGPGWSVEEWGRQASRTRGSSTTPAFSPLPAGPQVPTTDPMDPLAPFACPTRIRSARRPDPDQGLNSGGRTYSSGESATHSGHD